MTIHAPHLMSFHTPHLMNQLAKYNDAACFKDWPLIWTVLPIIKPDHLPPAALSAHLRVRSPPPLSCVLNHVKAVSWGPSMWHCL